MVVLPLGILATALFLYWYTGRRSERQNGSDDR